MEKTAVDEEKHVSRHALSNQLEVVVVAHVPVICDFRKPHKSQRQDDADDGVHHVRGDATLGPRRAPIRGFLRLVSIFTLVILIASWCCGAEGEVVVRLYCETGDGNK